ncbi:SRCRM protein, partial [Chloroceryle aenea]|nr:SRCRM protein [Chloroceryle aenea]
QSRCDGRLEVTVSHDTWTRVAAGLWDAQGARAVCQQLRCGVPVEVYAVPGSGTVGLQCDGSEETLSQCNVSGTATVPTGS